MAASNKLLNKAAQRESTERHERAVIRENTVVSERAASCESIEGFERAVVDESAA